MIAVFLLLGLLLHRATVRVGSISGIVQVAGYRNHANTRVRISTISSDENSMNIDYILDQKGRFFESFSDETGFFSITEVPAGNYWVCVERKGFDTKLKLITVNMDGKNVDIGKLTLK